MRLSTVNGSQLKISKPKRMTAYFISGLGADRRVFQELQLSAELSIIHLDWLEPCVGEGLTDYCRRLAAYINTSEDFVLIGLSFGGIIAAELSQIVKPKQTIILSSAGSRHELPWYFRLAGHLHLHTLISPVALKFPTPFTYWIFSTVTREERLLLKSILIDTPPEFLRWAIRSILTWRRNEKPKNIYHIHGSGDRVLPIRYVNADTVVQGGGHFMVFSLAEIISSILNNKLGYN